MKTKSTRHLGVKYLLALLLTLFFSSSFAASRYWVGGASANFSATSSWSATSGGASGASIPISGDDVYFDGVTVLGVSTYTNATVTLTATTAVTSMTVSSGGTISFTGSFALTTNSGLTFTGGTKISLNSSSNFILGNGGAFTISGMDASNYITASPTNGTAGAIQFNTSTTTNQLYVDPNVSFFNLVCSKGTMNLASNMTTVRFGFSSGSNNPTFKLNSGVTLTIAGNNTSTLNTTGTIDASAVNSKVRISASAASILSASRQIFSMPIYNFEINSSGTYVPFSPITVNNLTLTTGSINNTTNNITISDGGTITRRAGTLTAAPTFGTKTNVIYSNTGTMATSFELPSTVASLTASGSAALTLSAPVTITDTLYLTSNTLTNSATNNITFDGGSNPAYIVRTAGTIGGSGSTSLVFTSQVSVIINGSTGLTSGFELPFSSSRLKDLTVNNSVSYTLGASRTVNGVLTLSNGIFQTGALTLTLGASASAILAPGTRLNINGGTANFNSRPVTVQANASSTAAIVNSGTLSNASNVTLQQWVTGQRGYRVLSNPFSTALTPSTVGTANGITITGASDVKTYNGVTNAWTGSISSIPANTPYSVFVRGLSSEVTGLSYSTGPTAFAYGVTGTLNGNSVTLNQNNSNDTAWTITGNPFAAPVNSLALTGGTEGTPYYIYSMAQNNTGARIKAGGWVAAGSNSSTTTPIPMMGAIAYQAGTSAPATFDVLSSSINTTDAAQTGLFGQGDAITQLELQVAKDGNYQDKLFVRFNANSTEKGIERMDLPKLNNDVTNIYTITSDKARLAVDARKGIDATIPVGITSPVGKYTFVVASNNFVNGSNLYLVDKLLNTKTALEPGATYSFEITGDAATQGDNRFELGTVKTAINETIASESFVVKVLGAVVNNQATVQVRGAKSTSVQITVTDMQGKIVSNTTSSNTINKVQLANGSGMYIIKVTDGDNSIVSKVVKP